MPRSRSPLVVHLVHSLKGGGTERTLLRLLEAFDRRRCRHAVITLRNAGAPAAGLPDDVACCAVGAAGRQRSAALGVRRMLSWWQADIVHARNTGCWTDAVLATLGLPVKVVLGYHGVDRVGPFARRRKRIARVARWRGATFTSVSEAGRGRLCSELGVDPDRIVLLPNGVDLSRFKPSPERRNVVRASLGLPADAFVLGTVGSLTPVKRADLFIDAAARLTDRCPSLHMLLIGDGPLREALGRDIERRGLARRVRLLGAREDVPELLPALDAYACASDSEEMSNALLEALAAGLPAIATDVGDHAELLLHGRAGLVVPPRDTTALAAAVESLSTSAAPRRDLVAAAQRRARDFDFTRTLAAYEAFYTSLIEGLEDRVARPAPALSPGWHSPA